MAHWLTRLCPGDHYHLPIEGSSPGIGSRAEAAGIYQFPLCYSIFRAIEQIFHYKGEDAYMKTEVEEPEWMKDDEEMKEEASPDPDAEPSPPLRGVLGRLRDEGKQQAQRTILRLHRNLGHPTKKEFIRLLQNKGASTQLIEAAQEHEYALYVTYIDDQPESQSFQFRGTPASISESKLTPCGSRSQVTNTSSLCS